MTFAKVTVRPARLEDASAITEIYNQGSALAKRQMEFQLGWRRQSPGVACDT